MKSESGGWVSYGPPALRRLALAVAVLYDVDLTPRDDGLLLSAKRDVRVTWATVRAIVAGDRDGGEQAQLQVLADWLKARRELECGVHLTALGMPTEYAGHPGAEWVREHVPGGALDLGLGYATPVLPMPAGALEHAGLSPADVWPAARADLEELGELAAARDRRHRPGPLTPLRDADVVTLLGSAALRRELAGCEGDGMAALVVPLRTRGWRARYISDPAYGPALAAAMAPEERGFERPLLVTAEEVSEVRAGGDPLRLLRGDAQPA